MDQAAIERIDKKVLPIAVAAVLADKKVKLVAKVNHADNFALYYRHIAHGAIMDFVIPITDERTRKNKPSVRNLHHSDWLNHMCNTKVSGVNSDQLDLLAIKAGRQAYAQLHPERCK